MVSPQQEEIFGVFDLVAEEEEDGLETLLSSVDIITKEKVVGRWGETTHFEESNEVGVLAVHIPDNLDWRGEFDKSRLTEEDFASCKTDCSNLCVFETERLADFACVADLEQAVDHIVNIQWFRPIFRSTIREGVRMWATARG